MEIASDGHHAKMNDRKRIKVVLARTGLDQHDLGVRLVAGALRDAGMEVVYLGVRNTAEHVVRSAIDEDADLIGVSFWGEDYFYWLPRILKLLDDNEAADVPIVIGGRIFSEDVPRLRELGIKGIFPTDTPLRQIAEDCDKLARQRERGLAPAITARA